MSSYTEFDSIFLIECLQLLLFFCVPSCHFSTMKGMKRQSELLSVAQNSHLKKMVARCIKTHKKIKVMGLNTGLSVCSWWWRYGLGLSKGERRQCENSGINKLLHTKGGVVCQCIAVNGKMCVRLQWQFISMALKNIYICTIEIKCKIKSSLC